MKYPPDRSLRLYLLLIAYGPRWLIRLIPFRWRHRQIQKLMRL